MMKWSIFLIVTLWAISGCGTSKVVVKNCEPMQGNYYVCDKP